MVFSSGDLHAVLSEIRDDITGGQLQKIYHPRPDTIILKIYKSSVRYILLSLHARFSRLHLTSRRFRNPSAPSGFCRYLRSHLEGGRLRGLRQLQEDRIVVLEIESFFQDKAQVFFLVAELMGPRANVLVLDQDWQVLYSLKHINSPDRKSIIGYRYQPPTPNRPMEIPGNAPEGDSWNAWFDRQYLLAEGDSAFQEKAANLRRRFDRWYRKKNGRLQKLKENLAETKNHERQTHLGELLKSNFDRLAKGMASIAIIDYYDDAQAEVLIPLRADLTPVENITRYFNRAKKNRRADRQLQQLVAEAEKEIAYLDNLKVPETLEQARNVNDLLVLEDKMVFAGLMSNPKKKGVRAPRESGIRHFITAQGFDVYIGRNNKENDKLTLHKARGNDYWLHVSGYPGSHVVVRIPQGKELPDDSLLDAAQLAKYFSKARGHQKAEIKYTRRKFVSKPKGARPGAVYLAQFKTLWIETDTSRLDQLMHSKLLKVRFEENS
ncbi:NFACT family protein [Planctomycetota bacterium]